MESNDIAKLLDNITQNADISLNSNEDNVILLQTRNLLHNWANQTETFSIEKPKNDVITKKTQKTSKYRKLDAPMMVAKKFTNRPSADPTLIMDARLTRIKEMKAKRIRRMENNASSSASNRSQTSSAILVDIPDIDAEINLHRTKIAEKMKEKQKELSERSRRTQKNKAIDENMAILMAQESEDKIKTEQKIKKDDEMIKNLSRIFHQFQDLLNKRTYFTKWVFECNFETKAYQEAVKLNYFRRKLAFFACWKNKLRRKLQEREVSKLERQLRHEKQLESIADQKYINKLLRKSLIQWKIKYKTSIEYKIIEEQHKKRRYFITSSIRFDQYEINTSDNKDENKTIGNHKKMIIHKTKISKIKPNQKFELMAKRMQEQKAKKLEKVQKEVEEFALKEEKIYKHEIQRKKKEEHRLFLEQEKLKREEVKRKQDQFQKSVQRRKQCEQISQNFRLNKLKSNQFNNWKKILEIKSHFESVAEDHYYHHLASSSIKALKHYSNEKRNQRDLSSIDKYNKFVLHNFFYILVDEFTKFKKFELNIIFISNRWRMRRVFQTLFEEKKKRRKAKYSMAVQHSNKAILRKFFRAWPYGCKIMQNEEERENNRQNLMLKALQFLDEINSNFDE